MSDYQPPGERELPTWEGRSRDFGYAVTASQSQSGQTNISPELAKLAQTLGIDPAVLAGSQDPSDPPVYMGGSWRYVEPGMGDRGGDRVWMPQGNLTKKSSQAYADFYALSAQELRAFQEQAFQAGLYGSAKREAIPWGDYDEDSFKAWRTMVDRAAGFLAVGKQISPLQALSDAAKNPSAQAGPTREPLVIRLSNPDDIKAVLGRYTSSVTGGAAGLSPEQAEQFVNDIHDLERTTQRQTYEAGGSGLPGGPGGEVTDVGDIGEKARQKLFAEKPKEAQSYSYLESFNSFMNLLKGS